MGGDGGGAHPKFGMTPVQMARSKCIMQQWQYYIYRRYPCGCNASGIRVGTGWGVDPRGKIYENTWCNNIHIYMFIFAIASLQEREKKKENSRGE